MPFYLHPTLVYPTSVGAGAHDSPLQYRFAYTISKAPSGAPKLAHSPSAKYVEVRERTSLHCTSLTSLAGFLFLCPSYTKTRENTKDCRIKKNNQQNAKGDVGDGAIVCFANRDVPKRWIIAIKYVFVHRNGACDGAAPYHCFVHFYLSATAP